MRLPASQLTLPGGFRIELVYKTDRQIKALAKDELYGYWQQGMDGGKIVINKDTPRWRQLKTFGHELLHAVHDYGHWLDRLSDQIREEGEETLRVLEEVDED